MTNTEKVWKILESTKKACLFETILDGQEAFVVTIGMGKKVPDLGKYKEKRDSGGVIVHGSVWRYIVREFNEKAELRAAAEKLYHNHC